MSLNFLEISREDWLRSKGRWTPYDGGTYDSI